MTPDVNPYIIYEDQQNIEISCTVTSANPNTNLVYVMTNPTGTLNSSSIFISTVTTNHKGNYSCIVNNAAGNSSVLEKTVIVHCKYLNCIMFL